jgi:hypothetical protein
MKTWDRTPKGFGISDITQELQLKESVANLGDDFLGLEHVPLEIDADAERLDEPLRHTLDGHGGEVADHFHSIVPGGANLSRILSKTGSQEALGGMVKLFVVILSRSQWS